MADIAILYSGQIVTYHEAKAAGLTRFFTGRPCKHGHIHQRMVSNKVCCECLRVTTDARHKKNAARRNEQVKARRAADPERYRKRGRAYYARNAEKLARRMRDYRAANPEYFKAYRRRPDRRIKAKAWALANLEKRNTQQRARYHANPERAKAQRERWKSWMAAYSKKWQKANPEKIARYKRRWRVNHREEDNQRKAIYRANNRNVYRESLKKHRRENPEKWKVWWHNCQSKRRGAVGTCAPDDIAVIRAQQNDCCAAPWCRVPLSGKGHKDHIQPLSRHGTNWPSNIQLLCDECNLKKNRKDPQIWAAKYGYRIDLETKAYERLPC